MVGIILLVASFIPIGDMLVVVAGKGSARRARHARPDGATDDPGRCSFGHGGDVR